MPTLSNLPSLVVEFAPTNAPLDAAPTWVDITAYVDAARSSVTIERGRRTEFETFAAGTATLVLRNDVSPRLFDPSYTAGTYYGNLKARKRFRIRATWSGTTYDIFTGWCGGWPQRYDEGGLVANVELELVDGIGLLSEAGLSIDRLDNQYTTYPPYRDITKVSTDGRRLLDYQGTTVMQLTAGVVARGEKFLDNRPEMIHVGGLGQWTTLAAVETPFSAGNRYAIAFWIKVDPGADMSTYYFIGSASSGSGVAAFINGQTMTVKAGSGTIATNITIRDGKPHHVILSGDGTYVRVFLDGEFREQIVGAFTGLQWGGSAMTIGGPVGSATQPIWLYGLELYIEDKSDDFANDIYRAWTNRAQHTTSTAFGAILDDVGWPSSAGWRSLPARTGLGSCRGDLGSLQLTGYAINALRTVEASEQGYVFVSRSGAATLRPRYYWWETAALVSVATFADDNTGIAWTAIGRDHDARDVRNDVTVTNDRLGWSSRSTDSTSITAHTWLSQTINTDLRYESDVVDMSDGVLQWRKDSVGRLAFLTIRAGTESAPPWATLLQMEIGDLITVKHTPMSTGSALTAQYIVQGVSWSMTANAWDLTLWTAPIPTDVFVLDTSLLDTGRLGF